MPQVEIAIRPPPGLVREHLKGEIVAASMAALRLIERGHDDRLYLPLETTVMADHVPSPRRTQCPRKGDAAYFHVKGVPDAAWVYYDPIEQSDAIAGHVCYAGDGITVDLRPLPDPDPGAMEVIRFWFEDTKPGQRFKADPAFDETIRTRFLSRVEEAGARTLDAWAEHPLGCLALIILLDQFPRNCYRGSAQAFANDAHARRLARLAVENGADLCLPPKQRAFVYMPFMHSEDLEDQNLSVALYRDRLPGEDNLAYAISHRADIHRHGRFPYRDEARKG